MVNNLSKYHIVRKHSRVDGSDIRGHLPAHFGKHEVMSQCDKAILLKVFSNNSHATYSWDKHVEDNQKLGEYRFNDEDRPDFLSAGCEDIDKATAVHISTQQGSIDQAWRALTQ